MEGLGAWASFLLIAAGFIARKSRLLPGEAFDPLPQLLFSLCYPAMIIQTLAEVSFAELVADSAYFIVFTSITLLAAYGVGRLALRMEKAPDRRELVLFSMQVGNTTFIGLPVVQLLYGAAGIYFVTVYNALVDLYVWTAGYSMFVKRQEKGLPWRKWFNPCTVAMLVGIALSLTGVALPGPVRQAFSAMGSLTVPMALLLTGNLLAQSSFAQMFCDGKALVLSAVKVIGFPLAAAGVLWLLPLPDQTRILSVLVLAMPFPLLSVLLAKQHGKDESFALTLVVVSTVMFLAVFGMALAVG